MGVRKSLRSASQKQLQEALRSARREAGLTQAQVADRLRKPQSFVAKYESGERRLDVVEFIRVARAVGQEPARLIRLIEA